MKTFFLSLFCFGLTAGSLHAQQIADTTFQPPILEPLFQLGDGPTVYIDAAHNNFHTADNRYRPFANLLRQDGYQVRSFEQEFSIASLDTIDILVISNAISERNLGRWWRPTFTAFSLDEVNALKLWVHSGGRLWVIADHMPFAGAASEIASAFEVEFHDGFAGDTIQNGMELFTRATNELSNNPVTDGFRAGMKVDSIISLTGQAMELSDRYTNVLKLGPHWISLQPDTAWQFSPSTESLSMEGQSQGGIAKFGQGRVIMWGEAAMFSAQIVQNQGQSFKAGMNMPQAKYNYKLALNLMEWLIEDL
jgi:hypothetical protein